MGVALGEEENQDGGNKQDQRQKHPVLCRGLIEINLFRHHEAQGTEGRVPGGNGKDDDAGNGKEAADLAHKFAGNVAHHKGGVRVQGRAPVKDHHGACSPCHGDKAFD